MEKNIILPLLLIKLAPLKQFMKALSTEGDRLMYFILKFSNMSFEKIKTGIFYDPQICQLSRDELFIKKMTKLKKKILG